MLSPSGIVKLVDWGAALKSVDRVAAGVRGSPYWLAPEVVREHRYDPFAADVWAIGCVLIEMLDGRPPYFHIKQAPAVMYHISQVKDPPKPLN